MRPGGAKNTVAQRDDSSDDEAPVRAVVRRELREGRLRARPWGRAPRSRVPLARRPTTPRPRRRRSPTRSWSITSPRSWKLNEGSTSLKEVSCNRRCLRRSGESSYKKRFFELDEKKLMGSWMKRTLEDRTRTRRARGLYWTSSGRAPSQNNEIELAAATQGGSDKTLRCESSDERDAWVGIIDGAIRTGAARRRRPSRRRRCGR